MMMKIPPQRLMWYCLLFCFVPLTLVVMYGLSEGRRLARLENMLESTQHTLTQYERKHAQNMSVREYYRDADHFYIDKHLETIPLLEEEVGLLSKIVENNNIGQIDTVSKRLEKLTSSINALQFVESAVHAYPYFQETTEMLAHPVEVDLEDIKNILSKTEGVEIGPYTSASGRPQLIITDFKIEKKLIRENNEVFILNMKLIKREYN